MEFQQSRYEFYCRHLEYHDSKIFKILSIYFAFAGLFMFKIEEFYEQTNLALTLVISVGTVFFIFLVRTQKLISDLKLRINQCGAGSEDTIWETYLAKGFIMQPLRTSILGCIAIVTITILLSWHLLDKVLVTCGV